MISLGKGAVMLILCLILAHLIADFYLQTDEMVNEKRKNLVKHTTHHFIVTGITLVPFWIILFPNTSIIKSVIYPLFFIVISHVVIDLFKIKMIDTLKVKNDLNVYRLCFFMIDQILHIFMILLAMNLFFKGDIFLVFEKLIIVLLPNENIALGPIHGLLAVIIIFILATSVSGHMIRILLGSLPNQLVTFEGKYAFRNDRTESQLEKKRIGERGVTEEYQYTIFGKHDFSRGKLIGYIERLLVIVLTFYSAYPAIGFIVAAKSIARFKQMDDRNWAEYFLLGTLTSMLLGISLGIFLREILT